MTFWKKRPIGRTLAQQLSEIAQDVASLRTEVASLQNSVHSAVQRPRGFELLRKLGVTPDRFVERYYEVLPDVDLYKALSGDTKPLGTSPGKLDLLSAVCQQVHFATDEFRFWMKAMGRSPRMHRKDWEWFYITQALFERDMLRTGKRGLGFAVGQEPLSSLFAARGCDVVATDQAPEQAAESGWANWGMYSATLDTIFNPQICSREQFDAHVRYENADMNAIPEHLNGSFDFCWSSCAFEHLGSLEHGTTFVERSVDTLVPGGIAVHTTEFNLSSDDVTMETPACSIFRKRDLLQVADRLEQAGHHVEPFDWASGSGFAETVVDVPPYRQSPHLKLQIDSYVCTSIGLIVRKSG